MQDDFQDLQDQYLASLPPRIESIKALVREYRGAGSEADQSIRTVAHSLHGSGTTFGFPEITEAAKAVEFAVEAELIRKLTTLVKVLKEVTIREAENAKKALKILIIDDDAESAALVKSSIVAKGGYRVQVAVTAAEAQELLVKQTFALVVLDLVLPDRDGREILREMKFDFELRTPVFVLSAMTRDLVRVECMSLGAERVFVKPFDPEALAEEIEILLKKKVKGELTLVPLAGEAAVDKEALKPAQPTADLFGKTVLLAEDDTIQANLIRQRLIREGLTVEHVDNGKDAIAALLIKQFSLLILDVKMPGSDGFEVLRRARSEERTKDVPVIMLTAMGSEDDIIRGYDLGADDYILKPFSTVQLVARVKTLLKR